VWGEWVGCCGAVVVSLGLVWRFAAAARWVGGSGVWVVGDVVCVRGRWV